MIRMDLCIINCHCQNITGDKLIILKIIKVVYFPCYSVHVISLSAAFKDQIFHVALQCWQSDIPL